MTRSTSEGTHKTELEELSEAMITVEISMVVAEGATSLCGHRNVMITGEMIVVRIRDLEEAQIIIAATHRPGRFGWPGTGPMAPDTMESGLLEKDMAKVHSPLPKEVAMLEPGPMTREMDAEHFTTQTAPFMMESGENRNGTARVP